MNMLRLGWILLAVLFAGCGGSGGDSGAPELTTLPPIAPAFAGVDLSAPYPTRTTSDIVYGVAPVNQAAPADLNLLLDLYEPAVDLAGADVASVVIIHGGGFVGGSRQQSQLQRFGEELAARGFVAVSIDYRLVPDDPVLSAPYEALFNALNVPAPASDTVRALLAALEDTRQAMEWLDAALTDQGATTGGLALLGSSAGAVTSLDYSYSLDNVGLPTLPVDAVAALWGSLVLGQDDVDAIRAGDPPVVMIHGTQDPTVNYELGSLLVASRAETAGVPHELMTNVGAGHGYGDNDIFNRETFPGSGQTQADRLYQFLAVALVTPDCLRQELVIDNCSLP